MCAGGAVQRACLAATRACTLPSNRYALLGDGLIGRITAVVGMRHTRHNPIAIALLAQLAGLCWSALASVK